MSSPTKMIGHHVYIISSSRTATYPFTTTAVARVADSNGWSPHLNCEQSREKARRFLWDHWKKRKRGYVAVTNASDEAERVTHFFIEPNADGSWRVDARWVPMLRDAANLEYYLLGDLVEIKWNRATADDKEYGLTPGTLYLRLTNITGDSLILLAILLITNPVITVPGSDGRLIQSLRSSFSR